MSVGPTEHNHQKICRILTMQEMRQELAGGGTFPKITH